MSKKDYQMIARALHGAVEDVRRNPKADASTILRIALNRVTDALACDNPRFNRELFIEACETGRCKGMRG